MDGSSSPVCWLSSSRSSPCPTGSLANEPAPLLAEADRLAWLHDWVQARPLFERAERLFTTGRGRQERPLLQGQPHAGGCSQHVLHRGCR